jgi:hypothetical protein
MLRKERPEVTKKNNNSNSRKNKVEIVVKRNYVHVGSNIAAK